MESDIPPIGLDNPDTLNVTFKGEPQSAGPLPPPSGMAPVPVPVNTCATTAVPLTKLAPTNQARMELLFMRLTEFATHIEVKAKLPEQPRCRAVALNSTS